MEWWKTLMADSGAVASGTGILLFGHLLNDGIHAVILVGTAILIVARIYDLFFHRKK